jgi:hypothetical protein
MKIFSLILWVSVGLCTLVLLHISVTSTEWQQKDLLAIQQQVRAMDTIQKFSQQIIQKNLDKQRYLMWLYGMGKGERAFLNRLLVVPNALQPLLDLTDSLYLRQLPVTYAITEQAQVSDSIIDQVIKPARRSLNQIVQKDSLFKHFILPTHYPATVLSGNNYPLVFVKLSLQHLKSQLIQLQDAAIQRVISSVCMGIIKFDVLKGQAYSNSVLVFENSTYKSQILIVETFTRNSSPDAVNLQMTAPPYKVVCNRYEGEGEFIVRDTYLNKGDSNRVLTGFVSFTNQYHRDTTIKVSMTYKIKTRKK